MRYSHISPILLLSFILASCAPDCGIHDCGLRDRVIACGAGLSEDIQASLAASLNKSAAADFKDNVKAVIFSKIPPQDRLKAYEDYIRCIEQK